MWIFCFHKNIIKTAMNTKDFAMIGIVTFLCAGFLAFNGWQSLQVKNLALAALTSKPEKSVTLLPETETVSPLNKESETNVQSEILKIQLKDKDNQLDIEKLKHRIDLLEKQIIALKSKPSVSQSKVKEPAKKQSIAKKEPTQANSTDQIMTETQNLFPTISYGSSSAAPTQSYKKIVISEVQLASNTDEKEEFVELYNPNDEDIDVTGWYIHKKTKMGPEESTFVSNTLFKGKKISPQEYFLVARENYFTDLADIFVKNALAADSTLFLKNPNGEIVDTIGWGEAQNFEASPATNPTDGESLQRNSPELDTDNNFNDFDVGQPTPKVQNEAFISDPEPVVTLPELPVVETSSGTTASIIKVLINEIKLEGETVKDEFIELYNLTNQPIDLAGFSLKKKTASGNESNLVNSGAFSGVIPPLWFFLIAPQPNDTTTPTNTGSISPDLTYSGKTFSVAENNTVLLYDNAGNLLDKVGFGSAEDFEMAPAENPPKSASIERKNLGQDTDNNLEDFIILNPSTPKGSQDP